MQEIQNLNKILQSFKIDASAINYTINDNYFFFDLKLNGSTRINSIQKFSDEISLSLMADNKPNIKVIHNQGVVRLEFAKKSKSLLSLTNILPKSSPKGQIPCLLGKGVNNENVWMDLAQNPHLLVAGTTGSGKSVLLNNIICNVINYDSADLFLIDPKRIEFSIYEKVKNTNVHYSYDEAVAIIDYMNYLMEDRFTLLKRGASPDCFKNQLVIIDEFSDLILQDSNKELYYSLCKLAQKCRSAKIHIILSTQRPTANIIDGNIKANFPARIACRVSSHIDSKIILDSVGAENLSGNGDALIRDSFRNLERFQTAYFDPKKSLDFILKNAN